MAVPQGTGYTNLSKYVTANQGNQLGNTVQNGVQQGIAGLQSNTNQAQQQFMNGTTGTPNSGLLANTNNTAANQSAVSSAIDNILNPPAANVNAPQGQVAPTSTTDSTTQTSSSNPPLGSLAPAAATAAPSTLDTTPAAGSTTASSTPAATPTASTSTTNAAPGSFGAPTSNPTSGSSTTANTYAPPASAVSQFGTLLQGGYNGPTQLNNYNALQAQGQNLQQLGQNLNTQGGLQTLLQQYIGGNNYTQGDQGLDTAILGQTGQPQLQNITRSLQNVANIPQTAESNAAGLAQQTATGNQQFAQGIQSQLAVAQNPIIQQIQNSINAANTQNAGTISNEQAVYNLLNNPSVAQTSTSNRIGGAAAGPTTDLQAAQMAINQAQANGTITPDQYTQLNQLIPLMEQTGQDPKTLLSQAFGQVQQAPSYTLQQGANAQQAAQLQALAQLGGQTGQYSTYGGLAPLVSPGFNPSALPTLAALQAQIAAQNAVTPTKPTEWGGGFG